MVKITDPLTLTSGIIVVFDWDLPEPSVNLNIYLISIFSPALFSI